MSDETVRDDREEIIRLKVQVASLTGDLSELKGLYLGRNAPVDLRIESHERLVNTKLENMASQLGSIADGQKRIELKFEEKSKTNYGPIIAGIALAWSISSAIGGFFINAQNSTINRIERDIAAIQQGDVQRPEFSELKADMNRRFEQQNQRLLSVEGKRPAGR